MSVQALIELDEMTEAIMGQLADADYERFVELVDLRERALAALGSGVPLEESDRAIVRKLMRYDEVLMRRMEQLRGEASESLYKIHFSKMQKRVYDSDFVESSLFFDKRK
ncbi:hypothetical protein I8J29_23940 [Paenibacillus sp. MWE-103]|uniref:Flagellar protein FliT n=1 Tax=Paenibacillus artemisiicola TaxID=1172618 RepID=A0ABS3WFY6_9BACL|nr:hypothetical protein [Paenibacillus artemisiicola]MBO7747239.1 hypothetical protein [Paenibacillus artemisiicola]